MNRPSRQEFLGTLMENGAFYITRRAIFEQNKFPFGASFVESFQVGEFVIDGEGVKIGKGDVDSNVLRDLMNDHAPSFQFIPEVWQGHKNK